jgi:hypothetical protein
MLLPPVKLVDVDEHSKPRFPLGWIALALLILALVAGWLDHKHPFAALVIKNVHENLIAATHP